MLEITGLTWGVTIALVVGLLALDLVLAAVRPHKVGFREATAWSVFYVAVAIAFGVWFLMAYGSDFGTQYFAGYIVEKSLSVDNLFVFVIIMTTFAVPEEHQHKVLTFGIVLALIMRAIFIALGADQRRDQEIFLALMLHAQRNLRQLVVDQIAEQPQLGAEDILTEAALR